MVKATLPFAQYLGMTRQNFSAATGLIVLGEGVIGVVLALAVIAAAGGFLMLRRAPAR